MGCGGRSEDTSWAGIEGVVVSWGSAGAGSETLTVGKGAGLSGSARPS